VLSGYVELALHVLRARVAGNARGVALKFTAFRPGMAARRSKRWVNKDQKHPLMVA
jgi:hypothetical protein